MTDEVDPLKIPGTYNIRDLGGHPTRDGRQTRWGQLLRADSLHRLTSAASLQPFHDYGLRTVIDQRRSSEVQELRDPFFGSSRVTCPGRSSSDLESAAAFCWPATWTRIPTLPPRRSRGRSSKVESAPPRSWPGCCAIWTSASVEGYVRAIGVSESEIESIREAMIE